MLLSNASLDMPTLVKTEESDIWRHKKISQYSIQQLHSYDCREHGGFYSQRRRNQLPDIIRQCTRKKRQ